MAGQRSILPVACAGLLAAPIVLLSYRNFVPAGHTGAPGETTCITAGCHQGSVNPPGGSVEISFPEGLTYRPGVRQRWEVRVLATARYHGFQATAKLASNPSAGAGTFESVDATTGVTQGGGVSYVHHADRIWDTFVFDWIPPATNAGDILVYVAGGAVDSRTNMRVFIASYVLRPATAGPQISESGIVNGASFKPGVAPGAWVTVYGQNLARATRLWGPGDFIDGHLPTQLDGVSVRINGKLAYVYYVSPTQINVQAPDDDAQGPVPVEVITPDGTSPAATVTQQALMPALFAFPQQGYRYAAAVHNADGSLVGPVGLIPGVAVTPARPGEWVQLYGTGFGPTNPPVPAGVLLAQPATLAGFPAELQVRIGGLNAEVYWAGLVSPGLYQFNVRIPQLPPGDAPVIVEYRGQATQDNLHLPIE